MAAPSPAVLASILEWLDLVALLRSSSVATGWRDAGLLRGPWDARRFSLFCPRGRAAPVAAPLLELEVANWPVETFVRVGQRLVAAAGAKAPRGIPARVAREQAELGREASEVELFHYRFDVASFWIWQHNTCRFGWTDLMPDDALGLKVWPPCPVMCQYLRGPDAPAIAGRRCLELGAGVGLLAAALAERGAEVTATECSDLCLRVAKANALLNGIGSTCRFEHLEFGEKEAEDFLRAVSEPFDVIVGADIIYVDATADVLFQTVGTLLTTAGCFILGMVERHAHVTQALLGAAARHGFRHEAPRPIGRQFVESMPEEASATSLGDLANRVVLYRFFRKGAFRFDLMD